MKTRHVETVVYSFA